MGLAGGVGVLGPLTREFAIAGQDDHPLEIKRNAVFDKGLQGRIVAQPLLETSLA